MESTQNIKKNFIMPKRPKKRVFLGMLSLTTLLMAVVLFVIWYIGVPGLAEIQPWLPTLLGAAFSAVVLLAFFGIVNITSDSFSDGGRYLAPDAAIAQARKLMAEGADVIDLGPASSNPDAAPVSSDTEITVFSPIFTCTESKFSFMIASNNLSPPRS